ncbi:hypothetical protein HN371_24500 [Candidatus Poribacteria bacterium]|nr:hypothetical protein [Candidatus Poribacteria bacterium]MBT5536654.1 hypothetical protein [Candidatus Poribacteria bacterium]MBT5714369.1 hypothetical protein [Candidatus Poribacteria bacterium]MBT7097550.1 hypothetical protein [Candidatus Poribacteria bacterium]MBT7804887.1 hypothetical protein [Candidatus Poribacteria bacterium]
MLTDLPFGLAGSVFRSPMPFGPYDPDGSLLDLYQQHDISAVALLASDDECERKAGRNLRLLYSARGLAVTHVPIEDYGVPCTEDLRVAVPAILSHARGGGISSSTAPRA